MFHLFVLMRRDRRGGTAVVGVALGVALGVLEAVPPAAARDRVLIEGVSDSPRSLDR
eukprot:m.14729 g.14729  ORF g.14729 m.14729 type:complete len:57 (+) comp5191_c0_seq1:174-344(+)